MLRLALMQMMAAGTLKTISLPAKMNIGLTFSPGQSVVDFGAQDFAFLDICRAIEANLGKTTAVDYVVGEPSNCKHGSQSIRSWLNDDNQVDIITLWDVYEHIADLSIFMSTLTRRVKRGGAVLIQTPMAGLYAEILGPLWHHFLPVQHLQLPSRAGITRQFASHGFQLAQATSFGANAAPSVIPQPYKRLFDTLAKNTDQGSTQLLRFIRC